MIPLQAAPLWARGSPRTKSGGGIGAAIAGAGVYVLPFAGAVGASVLVRLLGWWAGLGAFALLAGVVLLPARSPVRALYGLVGVPDGHWRMEPEPEPEPDGVRRTSRPG